ncbi:hypothetical protein DL89DRAFT_39761 [Linderina pennispora]|uniref:Uncharacterized protein n=1 Tax=Linderina pennispora TaxID=61395 RepID=A0A1Y1W3F3_9FUNG|nr:uncharacterized protein DL89DRAFT_39761 [Linderina pennispora]ORX67998.1 hypothetical protein DL89DRAFT_39761 [Linderina pennispora]
MDQPQRIYSCACLNVRIHAASIAEQQTSLEDITGVRECRLATKAVQVAQGKLLEIKPASSIDRSISVIRCLVCKSPVIYFRIPQPTLSSSVISLGQQQAKLPLTGSPVFLDSGAMTPNQVEEAEKLADYSPAFGMLLTPKIIGDVRPNPNIHIPLDIKSSTQEYLKSEESAKYERIREFTSKQDEAFDKLTFHLSRSMTTMCLI